MDHLAESKKRCVLLLNSEKNFKIYRERIRYHYCHYFDEILLCLPQRSQKKSIRNAAETLENWLRDEEGLGKVRVVGLKMSLKETGTLFSIHNLFASWLVLNHLARLLDRYPDGHNELSQHLRRGKSVRLRIAQKAHKMITWLYSQAFRLLRLASIREFNALFKSTDTLVVTFPTLETQSLWQSRVVEFATGLDMPVEYCVASWDNLTNRVPNPVGRAKTILVWGEWQARQARELWEYSSEAIRILAPRVALPRVIHRVEEGNRNLAKTSVIKLGYLASSSGVIDPAKELEVIKLFQDFLDRYAAARELSKIELTVRHHPLNSIKNPESLIAGPTPSPLSRVVLRHLRPIGAGGTIFKELDTEELSNFLALQDITFGINTSVMIEACASRYRIIGIPLTLTLARMNRTFHLRALICEQVIPYPDDENELVLLLDTFFSNSLDLSPYVQRARAFVSMSASDDVV